METIKRTAGLLTFVIVAVLVLTVPVFAADLKIDLKDDTTSKHYDPSHPGHEHQCANCHRTYNQPGDNGPYSSGSYRCPYCGYQNNVPPSPVNPTPYPPQPPAPQPYPPTPTPYPPAPYPPQPQYETDATLYQNGFSYFNSGNYGLAIKYFKKLVDRYPQSTYLEGALFNLAQSYKMSYNYKEAIRTYQKMINDLRYSQNRVNWFFAAGEAAELMFKYADAAKWYEGVIRENRNHPRAAEAIYRAGQDYEKAYKNRDAANAYRNLIQMFPYAPFAGMARERLAALGFGY